jgi:hypothetical protein
MMCDAALSRRYRSAEPKCMPVIKICDLRRISDNRMYLPLTYHSDIRSPAATQDQFRIGVDDAIILPMVGIVAVERARSPALCRLAAKAPADVSTSLALAGKGRLGRRSQSFGANATCASRS